MQSTFNENFERSLIRFNDKDTYNVEIKKLLRVFCPKAVLFSKISHVTTSSSETLPSNCPY